MKYLTSNKNDILIVDEEMYNELKDCRIVRINNPGHCINQADLCSFNIRVNGKYISLNKFFERNDGVRAARKRVYKHHISGNVHGYDYRKSNFHGEVTFKYIIKDMDLVTWNNISICTETATNNTPKSDNTKGLSLEYFEKELCDLISQTLNNPDTDIYDIYNICNKQLDQIERTYICDNIFKSDVKTAQLRKILTQ